MSALLTALLGWCAVPIVLLDDLCARRRPPGMGYPKAT